MSCNVEVLTMIGTFLTIISNHKVVCDVDPSDIDSILTEQLRVHRKQLDVHSALIQRQDQQLQLHREQLILYEQLETLFQPSSSMIVIVAVSFLLLGYAIFVFLKNELCSQTRYPKPEMPQTTELTGFAHPSLQSRDAEHLRSVLIQKPAALSCRSSDY